MQIDLPDGFLVAAVLFYYDHESIKENDYEDTIPPFIYSDNGVSVRKLPLSPAVHHLQTMIL